MKRKTAPISIALTALAFAALALASVTVAGEGQLCIKGVIHFNGSGAIHVLLVDEEAFQVPLKGLKKLTITPRGTQLASGRARFTFGNLDPGVYGIRCFQDRNGNSRLDRGLFGPSEPWGMSFKGERPFGRPDFADIAFTLNGDISNKQIRLK